MQRSTNLISQRLTMRLQKAPASFIGFSTYLEQEGGPEAYGTNDIHLIRYSHQGSD